MSGAVKQVKKIFSGGDSAAPAPAPEPAQTMQSAAQAAPSGPARMATPEEKALALRRRRGGRALLSQERMESEAGLGGDQTTLGA